MSASELQRAEWLDAGLWERLERLESRVFAASRRSTTLVAQREFWLEFCWFDQEYRDAVRRLARFCLEHTEGLQTAGAAPPGLRSE